MPQNETRDMRTHTRLKDVPSNSAPQVLSRAFPAEFNAVDISPMSLEVVQDDVCFGVIRRMGFPCGGRRKEGNPIGSICGCEAPSR